MSTLDGNLSTVHFDQFLDDGQSQSGAGCGPCRGLVDLAEQIKDDRDVILGQSHAGVLNTEYCLGTFPDNFDVDIAFIGKFNSITEQIEYNLSDPNLVRAYFNVVHFQNNGQFLLIGDHLVTGDHILHQFLDGKPLGIQLHFVGFNFGKIEEIID